MVGANGPFYKYNCIYRCIFVVSNLFVDFAIIFGSKAIWCVLFLNEAAWTYI